MKKNLGSVTFKYERLPNICYWCGKLDHSDRDCEIWLDSEGHLVETKKQFGPSLRAPPFFPSKQSVVAILGFYSQKCTTPKSHAIEARPEDGGEINDDSRAMEELTVVHNMDSADKSLKAHLWEKMDTPNDPHYLGNGYTGNKPQDPNISPQNPDHFIVEITRINVTENTGDNCPLFPSEPIGINPIMSRVNPSEAIKSRRRLNQTLMLILSSLPLCHVRGMKLLGQPKK